MSIVGREMTFDEIKAAIAEEGEVTVGNWTYTANDQLVARFQDYVQTVNVPLDALDVDAARAVLRAQVEEGRAMLARDGVAGAAIAVRHTADMQFLGQTHILTVALPADDADALSADDLRAAFEAAYFDRFAVRLPEIKPVLVNLNTAAIGHRRGVPLGAVAGEAGARARALDGARVGRRAVWFESGGWRETPIYDRGRLPLAAVFHGPAVVVQLDATTVVEPGDHARVDALGNLVIELRGGA